MKIFRLNPLMVLALAGSMAFANTSANRTTPTNTTNVDSNDKKIDATTSGRSPSTTTTQVRQVNTTGDKLNKRDSRRAKVTYSGDASTRTTRDNNANRDRNANRNADIDRDNELSPDLDRDSRGITDTDAQREGVRADNTARNVRDRNEDSTLTPIDQAKGNDADVATTRKIRSELMQDSSLSTYAKNVKIITLNGVVTLRGPVRSQDERATVTRHAQKFVSANSIVNRLEIAPEDSAR